MSHPEEHRQRLLASALAGAMLLAAGVLAQTNDAPVLRTNQAPGLVVTFQPGEIVGREQVIREILRSGTNEFMFVVPDGLQTGTSPQGMPVLMAGDASYYVSIRLVDPPPTNPDLKAALRESIASQYAHAASLEEFTARVADREGAGIQLRHALPGVGEGFVRRLWVPSKAGLLEFSLNAHSSRASVGQQAFDAILLTLRSNERGQVEIVRRSDKT